MELFNLANLKKHFGEEESCWYKES